jgi:hypothetical protein
VRTVVVIEPLTITLNGNNPDTISAGMAYADPGATAFDSTDGDLTAAITVDYGTLDINNAALGTHTITYSVKNSRGDSVAEQRTVEVVLCRVREITENIEAVTTWETGYVYIIRAWDFYVSNTLTIQPGVVVKFHPSDGPYMMLGSTGTIMASGTADNPIVFTSYKDDEHCGDNNGDGNATSPARNDWGEINTNGQNGSTFEYCHFYYGGNTSYTATLDLDAGSIATVTNCVFAHNDGSDNTGWYGALDATGAGRGTVIQNNTFYGNIRPLSIGTSFDLDNSNVFHNPDSLSETNNYNGIFVYNNDLKENLVWQETEVAYVIDESGLWISTTLTLGDDVVLKFKSGSGLTLDLAAASLVNHDGPAVYFTSYKDDNLKGDTNGDGAATTPADNDWDGIYDNSLPASIPSPYYFLWANILYDSY